MRTYRLQFSKDSSILARRFEKARLSHAERVLCRANEFEKPMKSYFNGVWALEVEADDLDLSRFEDWDEIYVRIKSPQHLSKCAHQKNILYVLEPQNLNKKTWIQFLRQFSSDELESKFFIEFHPWMSNHPDRPTAAEISQFLFDLKKIFPDWKPQRRPGVEVWDPRIENQFELDGSVSINETFGWKEDVPKISVVIPTYNNKHFVLNVLNHLGLQTLPKTQYEVILVDDGSDDQTLSFLKGYGIPTGLQLRYLYWPRPSRRKRGDPFFRAGLARNLGVAHARAENLVFLDSDILISEKFLSLTLNALESFDVIQFPRIHLLSEHSHSRTKYSKITTDQTYIEEESYWGPFFRTKSWMRLKFFWKYTCTYALSMKKNHFIEAGRFRRFYVSYGFEDTELGYHLAQAGRNFHLLNEPVYHLTSYSQSEYQLSQTSRQRLLRRSAKQFFLSTLDLEVYRHFQNYMIEPIAFWFRIKKSLGLKDRTKDHGVPTLSNHEIS